MKAYQSICLLLVAAVWHGPSRGLASEAETPFSVASVLVHKQALARPHDVELQGKFAFAAGKGGSVALIDVSSPTDPQIVWHQHDAERLDDAETVLPVGNRLFLGTHVFRSLDIRDSRQPLFEASLSTTPAISHINGMVRRGDTILAAGKNGVLAAFDICKPDAPRFVAAANIREQHDIDSPHDVDLYQDYAVVPDPRQFGRVKEPGKLALVQVFEKGSDQLLSREHWTLKGVVATEELVGANRVQVSGDYAVVGASTVGEGGRLVVVDLGQPDSPRQVAYLPFAPEDGWGPNGLTVSGQVVFLAGGQSVEAFDISDPGRPVKLAGQRFPDVFQNASPRKRHSGDSGHDLVYRDGYLYITGQNDDCLVILSVDSSRVRQLALP